jgi:uncharacterized alkaline shock family protein YloU
MTNVTPTTVAKTTPATASVDAGKTTIDDAVVSKIAGIAAREVSGVHALGGGAARLVGALRDRAGQTNLSQGVSVEVGETQVAVDITLTVDYPMPLQDVADDVRAAVGTAIENIVGMETAEINITIADVFIASEDDSDDSESRVK